jgi:hypothetical protein
MAQNIDFGVHKVVLATFREQGLSDTDAHTLFTEHAADAYRAFRHALKEFGVTNANGFDYAFGELKKWAQARCDALTV